MASPLSRRLIPTADYDYVGLGVNVNKLRPGLDLLRDYSAVRYRHNLLLVCVVFLVSLSISAHDVIIPDLCRRSL